MRNERIARDTFRIRLAVERVGARITPGQFVMVRWIYSDDPLLGRAFALYDTYVGVDGTILGIDLVYTVVGKLTSRLAELRLGDHLGVWGPLGNGFQPRNCSRLILVAGGIGQTPFLAVAKAALGLKGYGSSARWPRCPHVSMCYGTRSEDYLAGLQDFREAGVELHLATDDGSLGHRGYVTELLEKQLDQQVSLGSAGGIRVLCCGPEPMMARTAEICEHYQVPCDVSLETPMACGIGACFSCVARIRRPDGSWDYRRTCVEGPVFDARTVVWD